MKIRELWGIPIPGTEKAVGLRKVTKKYMGKTRIYYEPTSNRFNENNRDTSADPFKGTAIEGKD